MWCQIVKVVSHMTAVLICYTQQSQIAIPPHASFFYSPPLLHHRRSPANTMQHFSLFVLLVILAVSPQAATAYVVCVGDGSFTANSTYEANLRHLAAILPAETSSSQGLYAYRTVGYWPNRLQATSRCLRDGTGSSSSCAACIADAFQEAERDCPYSKEFSNRKRNCSLSLNVFLTEISISEGRTTSIEILASGMVLQAIGFGWLFFLLLQEWRDRRRDSRKNYSSLPSGDE